MSDSIIVIFTCPMCGETKNISDKPLSSSSSTERCDSCGISSDILRNIETFAPSTLPYQIDLNNNHPTRSVFYPPETCKSSDYHFSIAQREKLLSRSNTCVTKEQ